MRELLKPVAYIGVASFFLGMLAIPMVAGAGDADSAVGAWFFMVGGWAVWKAALWFYDDLETPEQRARRWEHERITRS